MTTQPAAFAVAITFPGYRINPTKVLPDAQFFFGPFSTLDEAQAWADDPRRFGTLVELSAEEAATRQIHIGDYCLPLAALELGMIDPENLRGLCIQAMAAAIAPRHVSAALLRNCLRRAHGNTPDEATTAAAFALIAATP